MSVIQNIPPEPPNNKPSLSEKSDLDRSTLGALIESMLGAEDIEGALSWPPDIFCVCAAILHRTGGYIQLLNRWPPDGKATDDLRLQSWIKKMKKLGKIWARWASGSSKANQEITAWWKTVLSNKHALIKDLIGSLADDQAPGLFDALLQLCAVSDEACSGVSALGKLDSSESSDFILALHQQLVVRREQSTSATLCKRVPATIAQLLPKMHTPQSGITVRSISHNLAFIRGSEVKTEFTISVSPLGMTRSLGKLQPQHSLNLLIIPWPDLILPSEFEVAQCNRQAIDPRFGFFTYRPRHRQSKSDRRHRISRLLNEAIHKIGRVDGVVLPELALNRSEVHQICLDIWEKQPDAFLIAGVGQASEEGRLGGNEAVFKSRIGSLPIDFVQSKHHRWQLDASQIGQYGLGSQLDPNRSWWEHIEIHQRAVTFVSLSDRITLSLLICEDLARQDPVSDIIRAVGPNLLVALLMDGPQLSGRWPAHYATVFADDPGSSVLTLTSLGMTALSRPKEHGPSRVVGLWRDRIQGFRQIELPQGADGLVLTLTVHNKEEWTADGRGDNGDSTYLLLNGILPIRGELTY